MDHRSACALIAFVQTQDLKPGENESATPVLRTLSAGMVGYARVSARSVQVETPRVGVPTETRLTRAPAVLGNIQAPVGVSAQQHYVAEAVNEINGTNPPSLRAMIPAHNALHFLSASSTR